MPGIVGLITKLPKKDAEAQLFRMVETLRHESFYVLTGRWSNERLGVYVGWMERKDSFADGMPLHSKRHDLTLVFSGEDFPESGVGLRWEQYGETTEAKKPSYLVDQAEEDSDFPLRLNGRFHGLLANLATGTATLFNDRYGMHRIYYHEAKEAFYFAAEAKAILAVRPELRALDPRGLAEFISCGCTLKNRSIFRDIHVLPPASAWTPATRPWEERKSYFDPRQWEEQSILDAEQYYRQLREVFSNNLSRYFGTQEKIGVSLTGGLDSRMIMSRHQAEPGSLPCYSSAARFAIARIVTTARKVARLQSTASGHCGRRSLPLAIRSLF